MAKRLGNILYWLGCTFGVIMVVVGIYGAAYDTNNPIGVFLFFLFFGVVAWLAGRTFRYFFAGRF